VTKIPIKAPPIASSQSLALSHVAKTFFDLTYSPSSETASRSIIDSISFPLNLSNY